MTKRQKVTVVFAAAAVMLATAGTVVAAHPIGSAPTQGPVVAPANGPDSPGAPDVPEPGDKPDAGD